jgi:hypothetical protein
MAYVKWFFLLIIGIPFELFAKVLSPVLACFVQANGWLPDWLWMFQTPDNTCDGDAGHRERWPRDGVIWIWLRRTAWLFRNSAYGFNFYVLGVKYLPTDAVTIEGDPGVGDTSGISGLCKWRLERDGKLYAWQIYYVRHYRIFGRWKCVRFGAGWKLWGDIVADPQCPHWLYFHPIKGSGLEGKAKQ